MTTRATATASVANWDEQPYEEVPDTAKTTRAEITYSYAGDLTGEGKAVLLMAYAGSEAEYAGLERVTATIDGRKGSFVARAAGAFRAGVARWSWDVVPGTATGDLAGLTGSGNAEAPMGKTATLTFEYSLA